MSGMAKPETESRFPMLWPPSCKINMTWWWSSDLYKI